VQDGITLTDHGVIDYLVVTSAEWWNGLPEDLRGKLGKIIAEVSAEGNAAAEAINIEARKKIEAAGTPIRELTPEQRKAWVDAVNPVWKKFEGDIGADMIAAAQGSNS
jgi:C4-dicarboxylate-binding protein DctP